MDKLFCFAQSMSSGKILGVFHDRRDSKWIVNFKKNIASAFQANYKGTAVTDETDSLSKHKSHYRLDTCRKFNFHRNQLKLDIQHHNIILKIKKIKNSLKAIFNKIWPKNKG